MSKSTFSLPSLTKRRVAKRLRQSRQMFSNISNFLTRLWNPKRINRNPQAKTRRFRAMNHGLRNPLNGQHLSLKRTTSIRLPEPLLQEGLRKFQDQIRFRQYPNQGQPETDHQDTIRIVSAVDPQNIGSGHAKSSSQ
jgi:hypothetical protein